MRVSRLGPKLGSSWRRLATNPVRKATGSLSAWSKRSQATGADVSVWFCQVATRVVLPEPAGAEIKVKRCPMMACCNWWTRLARTRMSLPK